MGEDVFITFEFNRIFFNVVRVEKVGLGGETDGGDVSVHSGIHTTRCVSGCVAKCFYETGSLCGDLDDYN